MQTRIRFNSVLLVLMVLLVAGCASVPMALVEQDTKAKDFSPPPNKASLYVYRSEILIGAAIPMSVVLNGKPLGQTGPQTYFRIDLSPGPYTIESFAQNRSTLSVDVVAGKDYYVLQDVGMGRSVLRQVDEAIGRTGVLHSKLIVTSPDGDEIAPLAAGTVIQPACRSTGSDSDQSQLNGETFLTAPQDAALIYIFRPQRFSSGINTYRISANGVPITDMFNGGYFVCVVMPGRVHLLARPLPNVLMGLLTLATMGTSELSLDAKNGTTYFVDVEIAFSGGPKLVAVSESEAKIGIKGTKPAKPPDMK
jgi:hypothetical protein